MKKITVLFSLIATMLFCSCLFSSRSKDTAPYEPSINLESFQGVWFQVMANPNHFQSSCVASAAKYILASDEYNVPYLRVMNICWTGKDKWNCIKGNGKIFDPGYNRRLSIPFGFFGKISQLFCKYNYVIYYVSPDYSEAIIANSKKKYVWILSRTPFISLQKEKELLTIAESFNIDTSRLKKDRWNESVYEEALEKLRTF